MLSTQASQELKMKSNLMVLTDKDPADFLSFIDEKYPSIGMVCIHFNLDSSDDRLVLLLAQLHS